MVGGIVSTKGNHPLRVFPLRVFMRQLVALIQSSFGLLLKAGERVNNLKKLINLREGFTKKDDNLPKRIMSEPIPEGPAKGSYIKPEELEEMLDDYYKARGWDKEGVPTKEKLKELGIL